MGTTWPTFSITLIVFLLEGIVKGAEGVSDVAEVSTGLRNTFCISPWLLLVPVATGYMIYKKLPSVAILFLSVIMACVAALIAQPERLLEIAGTGETSVKSTVIGLLTMMYGETNIDTGSEMLNSLVSTSGMAGMISIIIASSMYKDAYLDNGYEPKLLSRTIEDSATVTSPIIPWTTCGMTQANVLGVSTLTYAPYCIFNYLSPVVTVLMALRVKKNK